MEKLKEEYGIEASADDENLFTFRLAVIPYGNDSTPRETGHLSAQIYESKLLYRYYKLVFDDVEFQIDDAEELWQEKKRRAETELTLILKEHEVFSDCPPLKEYLEHGRGCIFFYNGSSYKVCYS